MDPSYFGLKHTMTETDIRLTPEYDGASAISIVEWLNKVELVCKLRVWKR